MRVRSYKLQDRCRAEVAVLQAVARDIQDNAEEKEASKCL